MIIQAGGSLVRRSGTIVCAHPLSTKLNGGQCTPTLKLSNDRVLPSTSWSIHEDPKQGPRTLFVYWCRTGLSYTKTIDYVLAPSMPLSVSTSTHKDPEQDPHMLFVHRCRAGYSYAETIYYVYTQRSWTKSLRALCPVEWPTPILCYEPATVHQPKIT
jgi:hypothetical protein